MKIDIDVNKIMGGIVIALTLFIAGKVWQAVEIAKENQIRIEYVREQQREIRHDLDALWANTSDLAKEVE